MVKNPFWEICERVAEVQALLDDHRGARGRERCPSGSLWIGWITQHRPR
jgi:hypothetical protein